MASKKQPIVFVVPGQQQPVATTRGAASLPAGLLRGVVKQSVRVGAQRGAGGEVRVVAVPGQDVVVLHLAGGPALTLHPETARDLMLAQQSEVKRSRGRGGADQPSPNEVRVPAQLQWRGLEQAAAGRGITRGATRGFLGDVLLSAIEVITGVAKNPAADFIASKAVEHVDAQVITGLYALAPESLPPLKGTTAPLAQAPAAADGGPLLVFVHGTFSTTSGSFSKLWSLHPQHVRALFSKYAGRVYGLEHPTLGVSPISNALTLAQAMPDGARLHLVTHSRGGLVAEVLARVCANSQLSADDLRFFKGDEYVDQRDALKALASVVRKRGIRVERLVRVACPARGTLLASKRLDAYLSVFKWTLELAGIPVAPVLVDFLGEVAQRRADPQLIPGLAAQIPDSPLVQWLHAVDAPIAGELRVVAGDIEGDSVTSWLKTLLADAFYWTDNDLIVQTRSMYGGAPRAAGASFVLDQGGKVSHFNYFSNQRTAEAIVSALTQDNPAGFRVIGPLSWSGESSTGVRGRMRGSTDGKPASDLPAVFVLPGILGSNLKVDGKRIWLSWRLINGLQRLDYTPGKRDGVEPDGPIGSSYDDLGEYLAQTHEVIEFAFDWRRPIEDEARRLATAVEAALDARAISGKPVRLLAHSMGGVLARTMQLERPALWQRMMAHPDARLLMLGTPNAGSWAPMQVLSGDDTFGNLLVTFGAPFQEPAARALMARFPGFIQLQAALLDEQHALSKHATWQALADDDLQRVRENSWWHRQELQIGTYSWGVPPQDVLDRAVALRKRLDTQVEGDLASFNDKLMLVVGHASFTPDGYSMSDEGLVYLDAPDAGDGRVTVTSARLPGVRTWQLASEHGGLANAKEGFEAYRELLDTGTTRLLQTYVETRGASASSAARVHSRPSRKRVAGPPPQAPREVLELESKKPIAGAAHGAALPVTVINGDLSFIRQPVLIGHYRSLRLSGTEFVMNRLIGGAMDDSLKVGLYPEPPGTHQVFVNTRTDSENPWQAPRPEAVIVAGLGHEGELRPADLVRTVRQAAIAWAQRMAELGSDTKSESDTRGPAALFEIAATMIGSGGTGITVGQSAQLVAQGVREADDRLREANERAALEHGLDRDPKRPPRSWPRIGHLYLIELYLDRATEAWRSLQVQDSATPGRYTITDVVRSGTGALRRPLDSNYRGAAYDFITAVTEAGPYGHATIAYKLDTKRARAEVRAQATQGPLLRELVARASNDRNTDGRIGRTLFQLLIPIEMEPFLGGTTEMVIELDSGTAGIPWELLDTDAGSGSNAPPWAIRAKLLRKLRTAEFRQEVVDAEADASVLVIGEPKADVSMYPRLPGARDEARAVTARLMADGALDAQRVKALISPDDLEQFGADALTVINALLERDWRIVHIAGHGEPPELAGPAPTKPGEPQQSCAQQIVNPRGVVLSGDAFLGVREIRNMRTVPELVFVNCCHLAARSASEVLAGGYDRARFAANVAEELIAIGVRCVIAAGWAVEDEAAKIFATTFYDALLRGRRFVDAVAEARQAAYALGGNTWAAYQCYGDPDWLFRRGVGDAQLPPASLTDEFAGIASAPALTLALESLAIKSRYQKAPAETQRAKIRHLEERFGSLWGGMGAVAESFGLAWAETKGTAEAIEWYRTALAANDSSASVKAAEQFGNLRARLALQAVEQSHKQNGRVSGAQWAQARSEIRAALDGLEGLVRLQPSIERANLCGSAWKRLALVEALAGKPSDERVAIESMKAAYARAEALARKTHYAALFYPALNRMAAELLVDGGKPGWAKFDRATLDAVLESLTIKTRDDPDFWSFISVIELRAYQAMAEKGLAAARPGIEHDLKELFTRVSAASMWSSVLDQALFVLPKYAARAAGAERQAANRLLAQLRGYVLESGG